MRAASDGPRLCLLGHVDTVLANPEEWSVDPWSGELRDGCVWGRGALDMKSQVAAEAAAALTLAEEGWRPEAGELLIVFTADEETGAEHGAQWLCEQHPDRVRLRPGGQRGRRRGVRVTTAAASTASAPARRASSGSRSPRAGGRATPRSRASATTRWSSSRRSSRRCSDGRPAYELSPEPEALHARPRPRHRRPRGASMRTIEERDPRVAVLLEPMLGVTLTPTMVVGLGEDQRDPRRARDLSVDCRVPPGLGEEHALERIRAAGRRGRLRASSSTTRWWATARRSTPR